MTGILYELFPFRLPLAVRGITPTLLLDLSTPVAGIGPAGGVSSTFAPSPLDVPSLVQYDVSSLDLLGVNHSVDAGLSGEFSYNVSLGASVSDRLILGH